MYSPELSYTFLRKWKKHNTIGALIDWDIKLKAGWIRTYSLKNKSYLRFTVYIKYRELDDEDIKFLEYFLYENRIIYKNKEILIAFKIITKCVKLLHRLPYNVCAVSYTHLTLPTILLV